jgi:hypothetical protein
MQNKSLKIALWWCLFACMLQVTTHHLTGETVDFPIQFSGFCGGGHWKDLCGKNCCFSNFLIVAKFL